MINTIIAKATKECNADCAYCCAPPDGAPRWTINDFKSIIDKVKDHVSPNVDFIWHGGEAMLMGTEFYIQAYNYARQHIPNIRFAMQTNLLAYKSSVWRDLFKDVFGGRISTSFDPGPNSQRLLKGSASRYEERFKKSINSIISDGIRPLVIGVYDRANSSYASKMYEFSKSYNDQGFPLRFNYQYPAGKVSQQQEKISPEEYGIMLIDLYNRWITDLPVFEITPLNQMFKKTIGLESSRCPWTKDCGGHFISIEPNGDIYNCGEFADLKDETYMFGNIFKQSINECINSLPAKLIKRRRVNTPVSCQSCRHFNECEGGCVRDSVLFDRGLGGKFYYCQSWMMVFDRIKASILSGEADGLMRLYSVDPNIARRLVA